MAFKVGSRGNIVLADRRSGLNLDCDSVNYPSVLSVGKLREGDWERVTGDWQRLSKKRELRTSKSYHI